MSLPLCRKFFQKIGIYIIQYKTVLTVYIKAGLHYHQSPQLACVKASTYSKTITCGQNIAFIQYYTQPMLHTNFLHEFISTYTFFKHYKSLFKVFVRQQQAKYE